MLPKSYAYLGREPGPKMLVEALKLFGTLEKPGGADNPVILAWAKEVGLGSTYRHDSIAWCGLFMAVIAKRAGKPPCPLNPLWALNWATWGNAADRPMLGDVLSFRRKTATGIAGHVGLYVGEDAAAFHVLGGNQGDAVSITRVLKTRLKAARRLYKIQPENVRVISLSSDGKLSSNEA